MSARSGRSELRDRARALGIETSYRDVRDQHHDTPDHTLHRILEVLDDDVDRAPRHLEPVIVVHPGTVSPLDVGTFAAVSVTLADGSELTVPVERGRAALPPDLPMGCHVLRASATADDEMATLVVAPTTMPRDPRFAGRAGLFVPAYALWERASPLPSFSHLAALAARLPGLGIDVLSTLPLYAAFLDDPFDPSPYAPMSRLHWNEVYIDDASLPVELPTVEPPPFDELIDWRTLARRRRRQLLDAARDLDPYMQTGIDRFVAGRPDVVDFARFRVERPDAIDASHPAELVRRSHVLAQYLANRQLGAIEGPGRAALALDLPIGSHPAGYETWAHGDLFASGITVGAPPDEFFADGQDWGFPPQLPAAGRRSGHALWQQLVARAGEHASILRIDHVMGVQRLWWIPDGCPASEGAYVRYAREELLAVIAAQAAATATTIIGEDLGTVPDEVVDALARWDVLGMFEEQFRLHLPQLDPIPARSVAGVRTHDMPAFRAAFEGDPTGGVRHYPALVAAAVGHPVGDRPGDVLDAILERLAASDAYLVMVDFDDLVGEVSPHNVPGQVLATTWRRRLREPMSAMLSDDVRRRLKLLSSRPGER